MHNHVHAVCRLVVHAEIVAGRIVVHAILVMCTGTYQL